MNRPSSVSDVDLKRWLEEIENDPTIPNKLKKDPKIIEVACAGLWLCEQLDERLCPESLILRIQYTAGKLSFGRDPWEVHQMLLSKYDNNELELAAEQNVLTN